MKKTALLGATVLFAAGAMGWALVACGNTSQPSNSSNGNQVSNVVETAKQEALDAKNTLDEGRAADYGITAADLAEPVVTVAFGDYDAMGDLSHKIQNGELDDAVVRIDGTVAHPLQSYAIVQTVPEPKSRIGSTFIIEGTADEAYPPDGTHVEITAKVCKMAGGYGSRVLVAVPETVKILD